MPNKVFFKLLQVHLKLLYFTLQVKQIKLTEIITQYVHHVNGSNDKMKQFLKPSHLSLNLI